MINGVRIMSVQVKRRREAASFLSTFTGAAGELLVDTTNNRVQVHDGATAGGFPAAKLSEVSPLGALMVAGQGAAHGSAVKIGCLEDAIVCSGASSASTQQIPNRAIVFGVSVYVVTAITGASSFNVDATASSSGGAGTTAGQFGAGPRRFGWVQPMRASSAQPPGTRPRRSKLTANGSSFTGGVVRIAIHYLVCAPPTS